MYFPLTPKAECFAKDVFNLFIVEEEQTKVEAQLRFINGFFLLVFEQKLVEEHHQSNKQQAELENITYKMQNAPTSYINAIAEFDKLNPQFFAQEDSYATPSFLN